MEEMTEEDFQFELDLAKAKARAKEQQDINLGAEVQANTPVQPELPTGSMLPDYLPTDPITLGKGLGKGVINAGVNTLKAANAVGSAIGSSLGRTYDEYAPSVGLSPRDPAGVQAQEASVGRTQQAFKDMTFKPQSQEEKILIPAGQVAAGSIAGGAGATGYLGKLAGSSIGGAVAAPEQKGLIFGDEGGIGLDADPNDDPGTAETKHLVNLAMDNMATAAAFDGGVWLAGRGKDVLKSVATGIKDWRNQDAISKEYVSDMVEMASKVPENATREQKVALLEAMEERFEKHSSQTFDLGEGIGEKTIQRDPVSVLTEGLDPKVPSDRARQVQLESLRANAKGGNAPKTSTILEQPKGVLDESLTDVRVSRGSDEAIEQTRQSLQDQANLRAVDTDVPPNMAKGDLIDEQTGMKSALETDEVFGPKIKASKEAGIELDVAKESRNIKGEIVESARQERAVDKGIRDTAYQDIPAGTRAGTEGWSAAVEKAKEFIPERVQKVIDASDGSFKYLNNEVRPRLSEEITAAYQRNDSLTANKLRTLRDHITDEQPAILMDRGDIVAAQKAKEANKANIKYTEKYNQGVGKELKINEAVNRPRTQPIDFQEKGREIVDKVIKDPNRKESLDQLRRIVGPENEGKIADVALAEAMIDITSGKGLKINEVTSKLQQMANAFPEAQKKRIERFLTDIRDRGATIADLEKRIPELVKVADAAKEEIYMGQFEGLFKKQFGTYKGVDNGYRAFQKMLNDHEGDAIGKIVSAAKQNPDDMAGLQAAWAKAAEEQLGKNTKEVVPFSEEFEKYGKDIFGDNPAVDAILEIKKEAKRIQEAQTRASVSEFDRFKNQKSLTTAITLIQTWVFGVLNPKAARIRTITSNIAREYDSSKIAHQAIDDVLSNSETIRKHLKSMIADAKVKMSPAEYQMMKRTGVLLGLYGLRDQTEEATEKE
jgi:hypothetical protein